jgi:hypothetical protein
MMHALSLRSYPYRSHLWQLFFLLLLSISSTTNFMAAEELRPLFVEGYPAEISYAPGDQLKLHTSTSASQFSLKIFRVGAEKKEVLKQTGIAGHEHPIPENAASHGCQWPVSWSFQIPEDWPTGYYQVEFEVTDNGGKFTHRGKRTATADTFFILRAANPGKDSSILLQLATNTYNAYNNWGGSSLYAYNGRANLQGHRVSFHRPASSQYTRWELPFVTWAESNGYRIDYASNLDLEYRPELLKQYKLILSVGHDEYWSAPMRDHLEAYISQGGNVAFFSGNTCCWQVRSEDNGTALTSWKQRFNADPLFPAGDHKLLSTLWSHHLVQRPENQLTGVGFLHGGYHRSHEQFMDGSGGYTVYHPEHWLFANSNLKKGDLLGSKDTIVGYECDGCEMVLRDGLPYPTGSDGTPLDFEILATAPAKWHPDDALWYDRFPADRVGAAVLGIYTHGGTVISVGSTDWSHGLSGKDPGVMQITKNILDRLSK